MVEHYHLSTDRAPSTFVVTAGHTRVTVQRKPVKNMNLRIGREGNVSLSIPLHCSQAAAESYLKRMESWIVTNQAQVRKRSSGAQKTLYHSGDTTSLWGKAWILTLTSATDSKLSYLFHEKTHSLELRLPASLIVASESTLAIQRETISLLRTHELKKSLPQLQTFAELRAGAQASGWRVRSMKTRWGSCSLKTRRISLNSELAAYPLACAQAVACHEACHLIVPNHSRNFYTELDRAFPQWQEAHAYMKAHPHLP